LELWEVCTTAITAVAVNDSPVHDCTLSQLTHGDIKTLHDLHVAWVLHIVQICEGYMDGIHVILAWLFFLVTIGERWNEEISWNCLASRSVFVCQLYHCGHLVPLLIGDILLTTLSGLLDQKCY